MTNIGKWIRMVAVIWVMIIFQPHIQWAGKEKLTKEQWQEDLTFIEKTIIQKHRYPFRKISRTTLARRVQRLKGLIPQLEDYEIIVEMARLVALIGDGHSRLSLPVKEEESIQSHHPTTGAKSPIAAFRQLPLKFHYFSDGLFITEARDGYKNLLGMKVLAFDKNTTRKVLQTLKMVIHKDNTMWDLVWAPYMATMPKVLAALKLIDDPGQVSLKLQGRGGNSTVITFKPTDFGANGKWIKFMDKLAVKPLYLQQVENPFWLKFLPGKGLLYVQINKIQNKKDETLAQFSRRLAIYLKKHPVRRLVLDIRFNTGGNNYLNRSLILAILGCPNINQNGKFFTIIGRNTFSAAMNLTSQLEQWTHTLFVGEPTGSSPSHYGDSRKFRLPNSGLTLRLSSVYWRGWSVREKRQWVEPHFTTDLSSTDFLKGVDPALNLIESYQAKPTLFLQLDELFGRRKYDQAFIHYYKFKSNPDTAHISTEKTLNELGLSLLLRNQSVLAIRVLSQNLRDYPLSFEGWLLLSKAYLTIKQKDPAIKAAQKALQIKPQDPEALKLLKKIQE